MGLEVTIYKSPVLNITIYESTMSKFRKGIEVYVFKKYQKVCKEFQRVLDVFKQVT